MQARLGYFTPAQRAKLAEARVGIAGAGGLGSNAAMMLARSGVARLVLIDCDAVEASNLNRQHYFPRHLGRLKVDALAEQIRELDDAITLETRCLRLDAANIPALLPLADIWVEALDDAHIKAMFAALALRAGKPVVSASGMGGFGGRNMARRVLGTRPYSDAAKVASPAPDSLTPGGPSARNAPARHPIMAVVGDFVADVSQLPPLAPRVIQCAAMQADAVLEWLFTGKLEPLL